MTAPALRECDRCGQPVTANRPDWRLCPVCTFLPAHSRLGRMGGIAQRPPAATLDKVTWVVPGPPLSVNRVYRMGLRGGARIMHYTDEGLAFKASVRAHAVAALGVLAHRWDTGRRFELSLISYFDNARADSDNPLKVVKDALQGALYVNDNQVVSDLTDKHVVPKGEACMVVTVEAVE